MRPFFELGELGSDLGKGNCVGAARFVTKHAEASIGDVRDHMFVVS